MNIKNRIGLSLFISLIYIVLIELFYLFNISSFSFNQTLNFINNLYIKYFVIFILTSSFYFMFSFILYNLIKNICDIKIYFIISSIIFVIHNLFLSIYNLLPKNSLLQNELAFYFIIIFTTTVFFYSISYYNLLK